MAKKINHWCAVCGKGYHCCKSCTEEVAFKPWRTIADTPEHFQIFTILQDYHNGVIDKSEAKVMLSVADLSNKDTFKDNVRKLLNEIFDGEPKPATKNTKKKTETAVTPVVSETADSAPESDEKK